MIPTESYNCYEYFKNNTAAFGDYDAAIHCGTLYPVTEMNRGVFQERRSSAR